MNSIKVEFFPPRKKGRCSLNGTENTDGWFVAIGEGNPRRRFMGYPGFKRYVNMLLDDLEPEMETEAQNGQTQTNGEAKRHG
jgi:hypothetical protein